jgi:hypothetical protein
MTVDEFITSIERPVPAMQSRGTMWHPLINRRVYKRSFIAATARATLDGKKVSTDRVVRYTTPATGLPRRSSTRRNLVRDSWMINIFDDIAVKFRLDSVGGAPGVLKESLARIFHIHRKTATG